jgi:CelD/BcsL family acetyltransferase involved in cellulose biosynthesis
MMLVEDITSDNCWSTFVADQAQASYFHHPSWCQFFAAGKNYSIKCFAALHDGKLLGILPVVILRRFLGDLASSLPFFNPAGPLIDASLSDHQAQEAITALLEHAENSLNQRKVLRVSFGLHQHHPYHLLIQQSLLEHHYNRQPSTGYWLKLNGVNFESIQKSYRHGFKDGLRQGKKRGATIIDGRDRVAEVYKLYRQTMIHAEKKPTYDFELVARIVASAFCTTRLCVIDDRPIGFICLLGAQKNYVYWLGGMLRNAVEYRPMHLLMDDLLKQLCEHHAAFLDLGGAATEGLAHFKSSLGASIYESYSFNKTLRPNLERRLFQMDHLLGKFGIPHLQRYI